jgi:ferredoxin
MICQGTGYCARLVPHVFAVGDNSGVVINPHPDAAQQELLEEAATLCPTRAITY